MKRRTDAATGPASRVQLSRADVPEEWLRYARSDLALARMPARAPIVAEVSSFHAQQAVEKIIKAVLVHHGIRPPKTENIGRLLTILPASIDRHPDLAASVELSEYAAAHWYPGTMERVTDRQVQDAVRLATSVLAWAEALVAAP